MPKTIKNKLRHLPSRPGVYLMKDAAGEILYVGKAKSLRPRVRSYFNSSQMNSLKTRELVRRIADFDTIVVNSEAEALILESNLIKEYQPKFNINLRDDKTYPYIKVTVQEPFPRIFVTRRLVRDGSRYFGPYTDVGRMRQVLDVIRRAYTIRSCSYRLPKDAPPRPCLDFHIGQCQAPCVGLQTQEEYAQMIDEVVGVLNGHTGPVKARLQEEMERAAEMMQFERAAELRDAIRHIGTLESQQQVIDPSGTARDVVGFARDGDEACGVVLRIREGKLLGRETVFLDNLDNEPDDAVLAAFVTRFYTAGTRGLAADLPPEILMPLEFEDRVVLEELLREQAQRAVRTHVPQRGEKLRLVELAAQNARHLLEERRLVSRTSGNRAPDALYDLQEALELQRVPRMIVCFDISHTQGSETVGSAVVFEGGRPNKAEYRRMRIKGEWGNDDYQSMREVVHRYFRRRIDEEKPLPDLAVIDGGKGQLTAARQALEELDLAQQPVVALAKREEEVFMPDRREGVRLPRRSPGLRLLQRLRDEAHRFAVGYNRKLRGRRTIQSEVAQIPGVGPARQRRLLEHFGSVRALREASVEDVAALPGFGPAPARSVLEWAEQKN